MIEIRNLIKDYKTKKSSYRALKGISLSFPDVQFVSILGPSGCGKTTLLNLIGGLDSISGGDILVDNKSLKTMKEKERDSYRNGKIGFIFQDYFLVPQLSVLDNVKIPLQVRGLSDKEANDKAMAMLERIGIADLAKKKSNELSGGQTQRAAIARALVTNPGIILADEPTGALDSENSEIVMELLKGESRKRLVILVTHNEELAKRYSDRIVRIKDGEIVSDTLLTEEKTEKTVSTKTKKTHFPFLTAIKMAIRNLFQKKVKTILTCVANSFGLIGIGFLLALNNGFSEYSIQLSRLTASSLPVILTSYTTVSDSESYGDVNADVLYPETDEIYPSVSTSSVNSYVFNNFTDKFFTYLDSLVEEGLVSQYVVNYGNSYSLNLTTTYPESLDGTKESYVGSVNTTMTSYNSVASSTGLPTSVFHPLYGGLEDYDLLAGKAPENEDEIILVVDKYNAVDFDILKNLGFYNSADTEEDVRDTESETKVKPISFDDILGKEYKVFENDDYYVDTGERTTWKDAFGNDRVAKKFATKDLNELFDSEEGETLKIVGIYRPKPENQFGLLSPSLCYLSGLQSDLVAANLQSEIASAMKENVVFAQNQGVEAFEAFLEAMEEAVSEFADGTTTVLPTAKIRSVLDSYFAYIDVQSQNAYTLSSMVTFAKRLGVDLIPENLKGLSLSDSEEALSLLEDVQQAFLAQDYDLLYSYAIGLCAYVNAFSLIDYVTILPTSLSVRSTILERLDSFNEIQEDSIDHASSSSEQVFYSALNSSYAVEQVGEVIDMASLILIIFAVISVVVSSAMTAILMTNNVLERRKEIGLFRSLGSRQRDILLLFQLETFFVGFFTGLFGSLATYLLTFPVNALIDSTFPSYGTDHIAAFTFPHVFILLAFSLVISLLSSLLPAIKAAREDPVKCLRSD